MSTHPGMSAIRQSQTGFITPSHVEPGLHFTVAWKNHIVCLCQQKLCCRHSLRDDKVPLPASFNSCGEKLQAVPALNHFAFSTAPQVWHVTSIRKIRLCSCLSHSSLSAVISGAESSWRSFPSGGPYEFILEPLLFDIVMNDWDTGTLCTLTKSADSTKLWGVADKPEGLGQAVQTGS